MLQELVLSVVIATGYCPCKKCCKVYSTRHHKVTASGKVALSTHTLACEKGRMGDVALVLEPLSLRQCEDRGSAITKGRIDVYFDSHQEALRWGRKPLKVIWLGNWDLRSMKRALYPIQQLIRGLRDYLLTFLVSG